MQTVTLRIARRASAEDAPRWQTYALALPADDQWSLWDALEAVYQTLDPTLSFFRHAACRGAACGRCVVRCDGKPVLACRTPVQPGRTYTLEPATAAVVRDLLCFATDVHRLAE